MNTAPVLKLVNRCRKELGLPALARLPEGRRNSGTTCPIANALGNERKVYVDGAQLRFTSRKRADAVAKALDETVFRDYSATDFPWYISTRAFTEFVRAFDRGYIPQLVKRPSGRHYVLEDGAK